VHTTENGQDEPLVSDEDELLATAAAIAEAAAATEGLEGRGVASNDEEILSVCVSCPCTKLLAKQPDLARASMCLCM